MRKMGVFAFFAVGLAIVMLLIMASELVWPIKETRTTGVRLVEEVAGLDEPKDSRSESASKVLPALEPEDGRIQLRGLVSSSAGNTIPGARVWLLLAGRVEVETAASSEGRFRFALDRNWKAISVTATAEGYGYASREVDEVSSESSDVELVLPDALTIRGQVVFPPGIGMASGMQVFAVPFEGDRGVSTEEIRLARSGHPRFRAAPVEDGGRFELTGLAEGEQWLLIAGGRGLASQTKDLAPITASNSTEVELLVEPIYVLDVRMVDAITGGDLLCADGLWLFPGGGYRIPPELDDHRRRLAAAVLAGWDPGGLRAVHFSRRSDWQFWAFAGETTEEKIGPVKARMTAPGYEAVKTELWALAMSEQGYERQLVRLNRIVSGFGTLRLRLTGESNQLASLAQLIEKGLSPGLLLKLMTTGERIGGAIEFSARFFELEDRDISLAGIPAGEYRPHIDVGMVRSRADPEIVTIVPHRTTEVELDLSVPATLTLQVRVDGAEYDGRLRARVDNYPIEGGKLVPEAGPAQEIFHFREPPYVIPGAHPGSSKTEVFISGWKPVVVETQVSEGTENEAVVAVDRPVSAK